MYKEYRITKEIKACLLKRKKKKIYVKVVQNSYSREVREVVLDNEVRDQQELDHA